jgi:hypothetical protein
LYGGFKLLRAWERRTDGFCVEKIQSPQTHTPLYVQSTPSPNDVQKANALLHQEFYYLGKGFQCYVFESSDGKYVIKFFRYQRLTLPLVYKWIGKVPFFEKTIAKKNRELEKRKMHLFRGFALAFEQAQEETALVYVHLAKTNGLHPPITLIDKANNRYVVPIDGVEFLIQRRAKHIKPIFEALMLDGKVDEAKRRIDQIFHLLSTCAKKGIQDTDKALIRKNNLGFLHDRAIYIDTGKLALRPKITTKEGFTNDLKRLIPLYEWFEKHYPELACYFMNKQAQVVQEFSSADSF